MWKGSRFWIHKLCSIYPRGGEIQSAPFNAWAFPPGKKWYLTYWFLSNFALVIFLPLGGCFLFNSLYTTTNFRVLQCLGLVLLQVLLCPLSVNIDIDIYFSVTFYAQMTHKLYLQNRCFLWASDLNVPYISLKLLKVTPIVNMFKSKKFPFTLPNLIIYNIANFRQFNFLFQCIYTITQDWNLSHPWNSLSHYLYPN